MTIFTDTKTDSTYPCTDEKTIAAFRQYPERYVEKPAENPQNLPETATIAETVETAEPAEKNVSFVEITEIPEVKSRKGRGKT